MELIQVQSNRTTLAARLVQLFVALLLVAMNINVVATDKGERWLAMLNDPNTVAVLNLVLGVVASILPSMAGWRTKEREKPLAGAGGEQVALKPPAPLMLLCLGAAGLLLGGCQTGNLTILPGAATYNDGKARVTVGANVQPSGAGTAYVEAEILDKSTTPTVRLSMPDPFTVRAETDWPAPAPRTKVIKAIVPEK